MSCACSNLKFVKVSMIGDAVTTTNNCYDERRKKRSFKRILMSLENDMSRKYCAKSHVSDHRRLYVFFLSLIIAQCCARPVSSIACFAYSRLFLPAHFLIPEPFSKKAIWNGLDKREWNSFIQLCRLETGCVLELKQFSLIEQVAALHSLGSMSAIWNFLDESLELVAQSLKVECLEKGAGCNKVDNQHATVFKITCFFQSAWRFFINLKPQVLKY